MGPATFTAFGPKHAKRPYNNLSPGYIFTLTRIIAMSGASNAVAIRAFLTFQADAGSFPGIYADSIVAGIINRLEMYVIVHYDRNSHASGTTKQDTGSSVRQAEEKFTLEGMLFLRFVTWTV